jgi:hypothetical protein
MHKKAFLVFIFLLSVITPVLITNSTSKYGCRGYEFNNNCLGLARESEYTDWWEWCKFGQLTDFGCLGYTKFNIGTGCIGVTVGGMCIGVEERVPYMPTMLPPSYNK